MYLGLNSLMYHTCCNSLGKMLYINFVVGLPFLFQSEILFFPVSFWILIYLLRRELNRRPMDCSCRSSSIASSYFCLYFDTSMIGA